jgi:RNA polymerase sigma-70 factor (sigma-E family)
VPDARPVTDLQQVFDREWAPMVRLATLLLAGDRRRAEEVVQDALLGLHRAWPRLADAERGAGYLRRSVVNGCRSVHRHRVVEERHLRVLARDEVSPGSVDAEAAEHDRVLRALRGLPVRQREVLVLRYWADADEAGIARTLGISRGAVKTHAHRGLAAVRAALDEQTEADRG